MQSAVLEGCLPERADLMLDGAGDLADQIEAPAHRLEDVPMQRLVGVAFPRAGRLAEIEVGGRVGRRGEDLRQKSERSRDVETQDALEEKLPG